MSLPDGYVPPTPPEHPAGPRVIPISPPNPMQGPRLPFGGAMPNIWQASTPTERPLPEIKTLSASWAEELPEPAELVHGLIHQGSKAMLGGGSKSMKSWVLLDLGISVSLGMEWLGFKTSKGKVLYLNFEIAEVFIVKRAKKICQARDVQCPEGLDFWHLRGFACSAEMIIPAIIQRVRDKGYALIILDPTYKLMGDRDENAAGSVANLLNQFERVAVETRAAVVFAAHYSKGNQAGKEAIDRVSGSGVFARDPDTILPMTLHAESDSYVIEPILRNFPPVEPFVLRWEHPLMGRADDLNPAHLKLPAAPRRRTKPTPTIQEFVDLFPKAAGQNLEVSALDSTALSKAFDEREWNAGSIAKLKKDAQAQGVLKMKIRAHNKQWFGLPQVLDQFSNST